MTGPRDLASLARQENWILLADGLRAAMRKPQRYGCSDPTSVLREVARLRGTKPGSLQDPIAAAEWLESYAPEVYRARPAAIGRSQVQLLKQLNAIDPQAAAKVAPSVFDGSIRRRDLDRLLKGAADAARPSAARARPESMRRAREFEAATKAFLRTHLSALGLGADAELRRAAGDRLVPCDLEVVRFGRPLLAIEIKAPRVRAARRYRLETLGMAALLLREFDRVLIVTPEIWRGEAETLGAMRDALELDRIGLGLLDVPQIASKGAEALDFVGNWQVRAPSGPDE